MTPRALPRQRCEFEIERACHSARSIVAIQQQSNVRARLRRIRGVRGKIAQIDRLQGQFPGEEIRVLKTKHPGFRPCVKTCRENIAIRFCIARGEELNTPNIYGIARGPGRQGQQQANDHPKRRECKLFPIRRTAIAEPKYDQHGCKKQRRFRPDEGAETNNEPAREPIFCCAEQIVVRSDAINLHSRRRQKNQKRERGEKCCQNFRLRHGGVVGSEGTKSSEPERSRGDSVARRIGSARGQTIGDARGQDTRSKIERSLREHDCAATRAKQKENCCEECRIAGRALIRGEKLAVRAETVNMVVEPVAAKLFVIGRISGREWEMPDKKRRNASPASKASARCLTNVLVNMCTVEDESDCPGIVASGGLAAKTTLTKAWH